MEFPSSNNTRNFYSAAFIWQDKSSRSISLPDFRFPLQNGRLFSMIFRFILMQIVIKNEFYICSITIYFIYYNLLIIINNNKLQSQNMPHYHPLSSFYHDHYHPFKKFLTVIGHPHFRSLFFPQYGDYRCKMAGYFLTNKMQKIKYFYFNKYLRIFLKKIWCTWLLLKLPSSAQACLQQE